MQLIAHIKRFILLPPEKPHIKLLGYYLILVFLDSAACQIFKYPPATTVGIISTREC